jgi:hypothetical protein
MSPNLDGTARPRSGLEHSCGKWADKLVISFSDQDPPSSSRLLRALNHGTRKFVRRENVWCLQQRRLFVFVNFKPQTDREAEKRMLAWKAKTNFAGEKGSLQKYLTNGAVTA